MMVSVIFFPYRWDRDVQLWASNAEFLWRVPLQQVHWVSGTMNERSTRSCRLCVVTHAACMTRVFSAFELPEFHLAAWLFKFYAGERISDLKPFMHAIFVDNRWHCLSFCTTNKLLVILKCVKVYGCALCWEDLMAWFLNVVCWCISLLRFLKPVCTYHKVARLLLVFWY